VFVSSLRGEVARLMAAGLSLNEIAHRLGVARSTVGYHAAELRRAEQPRPDVTSRAGGPPVAAVSVTRARVRELLETGTTRAAIAAELGISRSTVSYHARNLNGSNDDRFARRYDWSAIARYYEAGHTLAECRAVFGFSRHGWHDAISRGVIVPRPARLPLEELLKAGTRRNRGHLKQRLFDAGLKERRCETCGLVDWLGMPLALSLHHVNGDRHDNRLENLSILCPNCHSQTDTFAGRQRQRAP
jgi:DNA-binding CsgD family transcriptional regulator